MKQIFCSLLAAILILSLCACGTDRNTIRLDQVAGLPIEKLEENLTGLSQEQIHRMWGQPDSLLSGLWGDIYLLPDTDLMLILCYEAEESYGDDGCVSEIKLTERQVK